MNELMTRKQLKQQSKDRLHGHWGPAILLNLVPSLISILLIGGGLLLGAKYAHTITKTANGMTVAASAYTSVNQGYSFAINIIETILIVGIAYTSLEWIRDPELEIKPFKDAFQIFSAQYFWGFLGLFFLQYIFLFLWTMLFIVPGIIKFYAYRQTYFIYKDSQTTGAGLSLMDCITKSRQLMDGHKMELFVLDLSFIGWRILAGITLGLGNLWLMPYEQLTYAGYYDNLINYQHSLGNY